MKSIVLRGKSRMNSNKEGPKTRLDQANTSLSISIKLMTACPTSLDTSATEFTFLLYQESIKSFKTMYKFPQRITV